MERRELLKVAGASGTGGLLGLAGCTENSGDSPSNSDDDPNTDQPPTQEQTANDENNENDENGEEEQRGPDRDEFGTVVDAVEEGADPEGEETINFFFEEHADDDTLLVFPPGTYLYDPVTVDETVLFGMAAAEGDEEDGRPRFVPTEGDCLGGHPYLLLDHVEDLLLEGLDFDFTGVDAGGALHLFMEGESAVRDVSLAGSCSNQLTMIRLDVRDPSGVADVNVDLENVEDHQSLTGIFVSYDHSGELTFRDCSTTGFSDNGLYASAPGHSDGEDGKINVIGGAYSNNNIANVRLGTTGAKAEDVAVLVDSEVPGWGQTDARGIRLRNKQDQVIEHCDIQFTSDANRSTGAVIFHHDNGGALVRDTTIQVDRPNVPAINALSPSEEFDSSPEFENVSITGEATAGPTVVIDGRDETEFRDCTIEQPSGERDGIYIADVENCRIADSRIETGRYPLFLEDATAEVSNLTLVTPDGEETIEEATFEDEVVTV